jgi:hypothetical protein
MSMPQTRRRTAVQQTTSHGYDPFFFDLRNDVFGMLLRCASGTATSHGVFDRDRCTYPGDWTSTSLTFGPVLFEPLAIGLPPEKPTDDLAHSVRALHEDSGLTWDQLAKLFNVSRRAVHQWAVGGRMNTTNVTRLQELTRVVAALAGNGATDKRSALLAPARPAGRSLYDDLRAQSTVRDEINAPAGTYDQRIGARHDR